ncbi:MAG: nucleotide sugar dehydrogenase [Bdellovibrionaceae bacterium]|nr:nucleotide sugar dehydrogenase [Pseudobdellovibrionaceae bacterium]
MKAKYDVCVIGGAGHIGLPLALAFAEKNLNVLVYDINKAALETIASGVMPFSEEGADDLLTAMLKTNRLDFSANIHEINKCENLIVTIGTPIDEFMNPTVSAMTDCFRDLRPHMRNDQLVVLRSTVYPGVTNWLANFLKETGLTCDVAFCPERIVQGFALKEFKSLPQLVSGFSKAAEDRAANLFSIIAPSVVRVEPMEAEFAKLFCNAFRYIQFAVTNQFYMICDQAGVDYYKVLKAMKENYPRIRDVPTAGFTAGPCLFKDTMQLSAFCQNQFSLGLSAVQVNEGLPLYIVKKLSTEHDLSKMTVGLLGMAFKPESDDRRSSLSYKLKKVLTTQARRVLTTDPYVEDDSELVPLETVIEQSDVLILCAPHKAYKDLKIDKKIVVDVWNFYPKTAVTV